MNKKISKNIILYLITNNSLVFYRNKYLCKLLKHHFKTNSY